MADTGLLQWPGFFFGIAVHELWRRMDSLVALHVSWSACGQRPNLGDFAKPLCLLLAPSPAFNSPWSYHLGKSLPKSLYQHCSPLWWWLGRICPRAPY